MQKSNHIQRLFLALVITTSSMNLYCLEEETVIDESTPEAQVSLIETDPLSVNTKNIQLENNELKNEPESVDQAPLDQTPQEILDELLQSLNTEERNECIQLINDATQLYEQNSQDCSCFNKIFDLINNNPYPKQTKFCLLICLAIIYWEFVQPYIETHFPHARTPLESAKFLAGVFILDEIKEHLKAFKSTTEQGCTRLLNCFCPKKCA